MPKSQSLALFTLLLALVAMPLLAGERDRYDYYTDIYFRKANSA